MAQRQNGNNGNNNNNPNNIKNPNNINQNHLNPNRNPNIAQNYISSTYDPTVRAPLISSNVSKSLPELPPPPQNYPQPSYVNNPQQNNRQPQNTQNTQYSQPTQQQPQQNVQSNKLFQPSKTQPSLDYLQSNYNNKQAYEPPTNTSTKHIAQGAEALVKGALAGESLASDKIYTHFKNKYPTAIDASGFNKNTIKSIIEKATSTEPLNEKIIAKIIEILDHKFKMTINSNNRQDTQYDTTSFSMDENSKIPMEKYLENYTNKVSILLDSDKTIEAELPKNMSAATDMVKIPPPEPFSEDFPIRDRDKQTDMMIPQVREYDFYVAINSNDRNIVKYPDPNNFIIDFAPAPSGDSTQVGYVERSFHNIKACDLLSVVIRDTSDQPDSSDSSSSTSNSYPYLLLQLSELQTNFYGTNSAMSQSFAMLTDYSRTGKYKYYNIVGNLSDETIFKVYNPRINLTKLTTRLLLPNGTPFSFGSAYTNDTSNSCITFAFRVTTIQKNLSTQFMNTA